MRGHPHALPRCPSIPIFESHGGPPRGTSIKAPQGGKGEKLRWRSSRFPSCLKGGDDPGKANVKLSYESETQCVLHGVPKNPWHMGAEGSKNTPPCAIIYHTYKHGVVKALLSAAKLMGGVAEPSRWNLGSSNEIILVPRKAGCSLVCSAAATN